MSENFSDSSNLQPKKTVNESDLNPARPKKTVVEPDSTKPSVNQPKKTVVEPDSTKPSAKQLKKTVVEPNPTKPSAKQPKKTVVEPNSNKSPRTPFARIDPLEGLTIGDSNRYRLQFLLGQGGMSKVYQASDTKFEERVVAVKLMTNYSAVSERHSLKRFMAEVKAISRLKHPNIIQILDFGVTPDEAPFYGLPFYVMEYFAGQTLQNLLSKTKSLPQDSILNIISQVCAGLKQAHQKGIVHRDLKPDNIFLVAGGGLREIVKILDFGIAKNISAEADNQTQLTQQGSFIGTYRYASPEQCRGLVSIDQRTDIYSLGIILYETISGHNPYNLSGDFITSQADWIASHIRVPPKPLKQQPGCENLDDELESTIMKCLAKSPQNRFSDLEELQEAIANISSAKRINYKAKTEPKINELEENNLRVEKVEVPINNKTVVETKGSNFPQNISDKPNNKEASKTPSIEPHEHNKSPSRRKVLQYGGLMLAGMFLTIFLTNKLKQRADEPSKQAPPTSKPSLKFEIELFKNIQITPSGEVWSLAISPDGEYVVSGNNYGTLEFFALKTGELKRRLGQHENVVRSLAFVLETDKLVSGDGNGNIKVWNLQNNNLERQLQTDSASIWALAASPNGQTLVSSGQDRRIIVWNLATGEPNGIISQERIVYALAFSPDGILASGGEDNIVKIWNVKDRTFLKSFEGHQDAVRAIVVSPDGKYLISGSWDKTIKVWELESGKLITTFKGHKDRVVTVAISNDSRTVFSGSIDNTIKVWSIENARLITTLSQHHNWVLALATTQQENLLVSGSKDSSIKLWQYKSTNLT